MKEYQNTSEIEPLDEILGQERAIDAMEVGLKIENSAYNIYVSGHSGTGKTTYTLKALEEYSKGRVKHKDWCYVYNFEHPRDPIAIGLDIGVGKIFKKDMDKLIETLLDELRDAFESEDYEIGKNQLLESYDIEKESLLKEIKKYGEDRGFKLKNSKLGMVFVPLDENYDNDLSDEEFYKIKRELEHMAIQTVYKIRDIEDEAKEALLQLEEEIGTFVIDPHFEELEDKYYKYDKVIDYLKNVRDDILENIFLFYLDEEELKDKFDKDHFSKYKVNLFVDHDSEKTKSSAPIIVETNPSPTNLFGKIEYDYHNGNLKTDFTKIVPGAVHKANGGYLVLYADQLLRYELSWDMLKRTIQSKKIVIDTNTSINPENIPIDIKVILIGSNRIYNLLYSYDSDFSKYFKVFVDFDSEMEKNEYNQKGIARFVALQCKKNNLKHFTRDAVEEIINYSTRLSGDVDKLSTEFNKIMEVILEGNAYSTKRNSKYVEKEDVKVAINERKKRLNKIECKIDESLTNGFTLIETQGKRVGIINGLSVMSTGEYSFGRPSRISVTTSVGSDGIVNIEREVKMSGPIHDKGMLILSGYLSENFAQEYPLSMNAYICFEQSYGGVDGDSASGAELYAILSSLGGIPLKQNIAATGSINQKGEIQVVGGIIEKIEGFYTICKKKGLTGDQGVIIPKNNSRNMILSDEVEEAIKEGKFHIYTVDHIEEAMEILTDMKFDQIKELVKARLDSFNKIKNSSK